ESLSIFLAGVPRVILSKSLCRRSSYLGLGCVFILTQRRARYAKLRAAFHHIYGARKGSPDYRGYSRASKLQHHGSGVLPWHPAFHFKDVVSWLSWPHWKASSADA